ncbi:hypothetical protein PIB30_016513 [Stylosanthes scabra]|uniref:Uncharacterized protein n=1 Tax=Stylosanthes scabra TaxID=79078 RepID=A0ABU6Z477_9FABA|nr:hypothetical protein [Stylosanthes scabra]
MELIQKPKKIGGLEIDDIILKDASLLFKWWRRFDKEEFSLWKEPLVPSHTNEPGDLLQIKNDFVPALDLQRRVVLASIAPTQTPLNHHDLFTVFAVPTPSPPSQVQGELYTKIQRFTWLHSLSLNVLGMRLKGNKLILD